MFSLQGFSLLLLLIITRADMEPPSCHAMMPSQMIYYLLTPMMLPAIRADFSHPLLRGAAIMRVMLRRYSAMPRRAPVYATITDYAMPTISITCYPPCRCFCCYLLTFTTR